MKPWGISWHSQPLVLHRYNDAVMRLDLCDREGKYSNGFCHWPQPAWRKPDGTWVMLP